MQNHSATIVDGPFGGSFSVRNRPWMLLVIGAVVFVVAATPVAADPITTVPTGFSDGAPYRLAFVTTSRRDGTSSDIGVYNDFVTAAANTRTELFDLGTTWKAIASTAMIDARDNTSTNPFTDGIGAPIFLLNDTLVANNNADLWDRRIANPLSTNENGTITSSTVMTGTDPFGVGRGGGLGQILVGFGQSTPRFFGNGFADWISRRDTFGGTIGSFYAISDVLSASNPVPEPSSIILLSIGAVLLMGYGARRKRKTAIESNVPKHQNH